MSAADRKREREQLERAKRIVAESNERFDALGAIWHELSDDEQKEVLHRAEAMHARGGTA